MTKFKKGQPIKFKHWTLNKIIEGIIIDVNERLLCVETANGEKYYPSLLNIDYYIEGVNENKR